MDRLILLSLSLNIVVLVPVVLGLLLRASWVNEAYGPSSAARGILLSMYLAILVVSLALLVQREPSLVATLLALQVLYKLLSPFTVGHLSNPVVLSNLGIAALHLVTLVAIWRGDRGVP